MKRILTLSFLFLFIFSTVADAQRWRTRRWEAYAGLGTSTIYGDIGGHRTDAVFQNPLGDIRIEFTRPSITFGGKYKINHRMYGRVNFAGAFLQGNDRETDNSLTKEPDMWGHIPPGRNGGYAFKSWVIEPSAIFEFYILPESRSMVSEAIYNKKGMVNTFFSLNVYAFIGVGAAISFPTVTYIETGEPFITDIYQDPDRPFQRAGLAVPVGIAARTDLSSYWTVTVEVGRRYTLNDYIDGYTSEFSMPVLGDTYDFFQVIFSYKIRTDKNGWPVLRKTGLVK